LSFIWHFLLSFIPSTCCLFEKKREMNALWEHAYDVRWGTTEYALLKNRCLANDRKREEERESMRLYVCVCLWWNERKSSYVNSTTRRRVLELWMNAPSIPSIDIRLCVLWNLRVPIQVRIEKKKKRDNDWEGRRTKSPLPPPTSVIFQLTSNNEDPRCVSI
jgi:hypothetical protein